MVGDRPVHRRRGGPGRWSRRGNHRKDSTAGSPVRLSWNRDTRLKSARSLTGTFALPADADLMLHSGYNDIQIVNVTTGRIAKIQARQDAAPFDRKTVSRRTDGRSSMPGVSKHRIPLLLLC